MNDNFYALVVESERLLVLRHNDKYVDRIYLNQDIDTHYERDTLLWVETNGIMALSYPGIMYGDKVEVVNYEKLRGILEYDENNLFLTVHDELSLYNNSKVIINFDSSEYLDSLQGKLVDVYYSGVMTRSLPPQIGVYCIFENKEI